MTAIVLAGGRSSRMGTPKGLLPFDGEPLIAHIVRRLRKQFDEIVIVAATDQPLPDLPAIVVRDEVAYQGPVGGICYGLRAAHGEFAFVTSCDSAFASAPLISHLVSLAPEHDVVAPRWNDRLQPLFAVYRTSVRPLLEAQLAAGDLRPVHLFDKVRTRVVADDEVRRFDRDGESFFNMNTPDDYEEALRRWRAAKDEPAGPVTCVVELLGVAQLLTGTREATFELPPNATMADLFAALARRLPALSGPVISTNSDRLASGYACNVNGLEFVQTATRPVHDRDRIVILSADAGG